MKLYTPEKREFRNLLSNEKDETPATPSTSTVFECPSENDREEEGGRVGETLTSFLPSRVAFLQIP